jgi:hypothetical protein
LREKAHPQKLFIKVVDTAKALPEGKGDKQAAFIIYNSSIKYD